MHRGVIHKSALQPVVCVSCNLSKWAHTNRPIVAISGGMDPITVGHIRLIKAAAEYGHVIVILNNKNWLVKKKGYEFMPEQERAEIISCLKNVYGVRLTSHEENPIDMSVANDLRELKPDYFANGGDRVEGSVPTAEEEVCKELGITMLWGIGGEKIQSSSWLVEKAGGACRKVYEL